MNPAQKWFSIRTEDPRLMKSQRVKLWAEETDRAMLSIFSSPQHNFVTQGAEVLFDIVAFGTGGMWVDNKTPSGAKGPIRFAAHPLGELYMIENFQGQIDTVFRKTKMTARQIAQKWPEDAPVVVTKMLEKEPDKCFEVLHLVHPNPDADKKKLGPAGMPWRSVYVLLEKQGHFLGKPGGFETMPWMTPRWMVEAGETYGRSPGWTALSDAKMLNEMSKTLLIAGQKIADPPLMVPDDGMIGKIRTAPNSLNVIRRDMLRGPADPIRPFPTAGANFPITVELIRQRQETVQTAFFSQLLQLFQDPRMTATQVVELSNQAQRLMAPMLGRLQSEFLDPLIDRVFDLMLRAGDLPPIPPELQEGANLRVEYVSPVTRSQRAGEARSVIETWNAASIMGQVSPEVYDNLDPDASIRIISDAGSAPPSIIRDEAVMQQLRQERAMAQAQQAQQQQELEQQEVAAKMLPGLAAMRAEGNA
jgi:hypothetical protein